MNLGFYLDRPFRKGLTIVQVREGLKNKKPLSKFLSDKETSLYLLASFPGRKIVKVRVPEKVRPSQWDFEKKLPKSSSFGYLEFADRLSFLRAEAMRRYREAVNQNPNLSLSDVKEILQSVIDGKTPNFNRLSFTQIIGEFITERKNTKRENTLKKYESFERVFTEYLTHEKINVKNFGPENINDRFEISFVNWLIEKRGLVNASIGKYILLVKVIMKWAEERGYHTNYIYKRFKVYRDKTDVIRLTMDEVLRIEKLDLSGRPALEKWRDIFIYQIICGGQRISDLKNMKAGDVSFNPDGSAQQIIYQIKGGRTTSIVVPIPSKGIEILKRYGVDMKPELSPAFSLISPQKYNAAIKAICKKAGITQTIIKVSYSGTNRKEVRAPKYKLMNNKIARKSFVSLCIENKVPADVVTAMTGHSPSVMRGHYLQVGMEAKREGVESVWKF